MKFLFFNYDERRLCGIWRVALFQWVFWLCFRWVGEFLTPLLHRLKGAGSVGAVAEPLAGKLVAVLLVLILLWVAARYLDHRRFVDYGFHFNKRWWKLFVCGVAFGLLFQALPNVIGLLTGQLRVIEIMHPPNPKVTVWLALLVAVPHMVAIGFWEEAATRGHPVINLTECFESVRPELAPWAGILTLLFSGVVFGLAHLFNGVHEMHRLIFLSLWGVGLAAIYSVHGELAFPIGFHAAADFAVFHLFASSSDVGSVFLVKAMQPTTFLSTTSFLAFLLLAFVWWVRMTGKPGYLSPLAKSRTRKMAADTI